MSSSCPYLLEKVLEIIFSWLPTDSLIRFKCVSRSWYILIRALIKSSEFVAKHLHNLITDKTSASLVLSSEICSGHRRSLLISFGDDCDDDRAHAVTELLDVPLVGSGICGWLYWEDVFGHCDGILCSVTDHCRKIMLCNPALQESKVLPKTKNCDNNYCVGLGFGYDSVTNDYQLVKIFQKPTVIVEVYSLSKDGFLEADRNS